ncbi:MAG: acetyl-CoA carboxylase carboxyl transferase subunit beta [Clostridiales bacterium]|nr:acetyl-CoA carboxylase carboxyl transferase subunit beta [Clostridiales bacterium]
MSDTLGVLEATLGSDKTVACSKCKKQVSEAELVKRYYICPECHSYDRIPPRARIEYLVDKDSFTELFCKDIDADPIEFPGYAEKKSASRKKSGETEAVLCGKARIGGYTTCIFVMNSEFMMASMGTVVGDRIAALFEYAIAHKLPVIGYAASGGARMQEGVLSLMQMAKTSIAAKKHSDAGLLFLVCLTDPTFGGVTASFATLGDVIIAEPNALIGFAGRRVIEQNTGTKLPDSFQSAEFQLEHGVIDGIVERKDQRNYLIDMLSLHTKKHGLGA